MTNEIILDDEILIKDNLLRSLHRNNDGHLAPSRRAHQTEENHNVAVLYVYCREDDAFTLHEFYAYSRAALTYKQWRAFVLREIDDLERNADERWIGVYGWHTSFIRVKPLRSGDLFIKIDKEGATGVRLSFDTRKVEHEARKATSKATRGSKRDRR